MHLTTHTPETAPEASRPVLEGIAADVGVVPNLAAAAAASPTLLSAFDAFRRAVAGGELDPVLREVAGLATGVAVDNAYGVAFHSTMLAGLGVGEDEIAAMRAGIPGPDERRATVYRLARRVALYRGKVDDDAIAGLSTGEVLEIVAECGFASLVGLIDNVAGRVELDPFLADRAWQAPVG
jgi:alkylhydroperoxidase family enzyme